MILVADGTCTAVWPTPPKITKSNLPPFCPLEHHSIIVKKFRIHLHQHPQIPLNDENNSCLTVKDIHYHAAKEMYNFCFQNDLGQVWAYLWNQWYNPKQWKLWARSADSAIYVLKMTMVVESLWRNLKHRNLQEFNRLRLDLIMHIIITNVLPRIQRTLDYEDFQVDWKDMSHCDKHRLKKIGHEGNISLRLIDGHAPALHI
ncbi:hypothetical protein L208DRAFT_1388413 [Tricholoma matsutake]|nr:hypothetical protein L208DRAFT_1388413 [Tricholoma matsutake 945]